jgi:hypothetical protein
LPAHALRVLCGAGLLRALAGADSADHVVCPPKGSLHVPGLLQQRLHRQVESPHPTRRRRLGAATSAFRSAANTRLILRRSAGSVASRASSQATISLVVKCSTRRRSAARWSGFRTEPRLMTAARVPTRRRPWRVASKRDCRAGVAGHAAGLQPRECGDSRGGGVPGLGENTRRPSGSSACSLLVGVGDDQAGLAYAST